MERWGASFRRRNAMGTRPGLARKSTSHMTTIGEEENSQVIQTDTHTHSNTHIPTQGSAMCLCWFHPGLTVGPSGSLTPRVGQGDGHGPSVVLNRKQLQTRFTSYISLRFPPKRRRRSDLTEHRPAELR